jgi:hypothetical protein
LVEECGEADVAVVLSVAQGGEGVPAFGLTGGEGVVCAAGDGEGLSVSRVDEEFAGAGDGEVGEWPDGGGGLALVDGAAVDDVDLSAAGDEGGGYDVCAGCADEEVGGVVAVEVDGPGGREESELVEFTFARDDLVSGGECEALGAFADGPEDVDVAAVLAVEEDVLGVSDGAGGLADGEIELSVVVEVAGGGPEVAFEEDRGLELCFDAPDGGVAGLSGEGLVCAGVGEGDGAEGDGVAVEEEEAVGGVLSALA